MAARLGRSRRGSALAGLIAAFVLPGGPGYSQSACPPPENVRVCQDRYGTEDESGNVTGRVVFRWENPQDYSLIRLFLGDVLMTEVSGRSTIGDIPGVAVGTHDFAIEGECSGMTSLRVTARFEVLAATPSPSPVGGLECSFENNAFTVVLHEPKVFNFIDVFRRKEGFPLHFVTTVAGDTKSIVVPDSEAMDRIFLQFFDAGCYGSSVVSCPFPCLPVRDVGVCQDRYGDEPRVFVQWLPLNSDYTAFEVWLMPPDVMEKVADAKGHRGLAYVDSIVPGRHTFGVRGICGSEPSEFRCLEFEVLGETPHREPLSNLQCRFVPEERTIAATWELVEGVPSRFIDVFLRKQNLPKLRWVDTIDGAAKSVKANGACEDDEIVLQFFNGSCHGSPLFSCRDDEETDHFRRGDANGDGDTNISDASFSLNFLFLGDREPLCVDAADGNDDGGLDIADPIYVLAWLFRDGPPPPAPGGTACGADETADPLSCCLTAACP